MPTLENRRPTKAQIRAMHKHARTLIKLSKSCDYLEYGDVSTDPCMKLIHEASLYCTDLHPSDRQQDKAREWGQWLFRIVKAKDHSSIVQLAKLLKHQQERKDFRTVKTGKRALQGRPSDSARSATALAPLAFAMALSEAAGRGEFVTRELLNDALFRLHQRPGPPGLNETPARVDERTQVKLAMIIAEHGENEGQKIIEKVLRSAPIVRQALVSPRTMDELIRKHEMKAFIRNGGPPKKLAR